MHYPCEHNSFVGFGGKSKVITGQQRERQTSTVYSCKQDSSRRANIDGWHICHVASLPAWSLSSVLVRNRRTWILVICCPFIEIIIIIREPSMQSWLWTPAKYCNVRLTHAQSFETFFVIWHPLGLAVCFASTFYMQVCILPDWRNCMLSLCESGLPYR